MTATTIKVSTELRDRLKVQAVAHRRTIAEHLEVLLEEEARRERFDEVRRKMAVNPPDDEYRREAEEWQSARW